MYQWARGESYEFNSWRKRLLIRFWSFWETFFVFEKSQTFLVFKTPSQVPGMMRKRSPNIPKTFRKNLFSNPNIFLEYVVNMSKKCILAYHNMSYNIKWYDIIWCDIISQPRPRPRPCDANEPGNFVQELYPGKMTFKKSKHVKKIRNKILYIFIVESLQDLFSRISFDYFLFSRICFLWAGSQFVRVTSISRQSVEPRSLRHYKNMQSWRCADPMHTPLVP